MPESPGIYFSWGNIEGHPAGAGYNFTQTVYDATPAAAISDNLSLDQDAARASLGAPWRMPTAAEFQELVDNCTSVWTSLNGMNGRLFTSNVNGKTLFFPAAGGYGGTTLYSRGNEGKYWSSTFSTTVYARMFDIKASVVDPNFNDERRYGFTVRAVRSA